MKRTLLLLTAFSAALFTFCGCGEQDSVEVAPPGAVSASVALSTVRRTSVNNPAPAVKTETAAKAETAVKAEPAAKAAPAVKTETAAKAEPAAKAETATKAENDAKKAPAEKDSTAVKVQTLEQAAAEAAPKVITFTVGFDADFPPYGYLQRGKYKGFDLDLAREVCRRRKWTFVPKPINWDAKDMELNSGSIDCIWNGFTINGRENSYEWSEPYVDNGQVVLVLAESKITKLTDLAGKVVAVQTDTPVQKALMKGGKQEALGQTFKKLVISPNYNNAVMELESGAIDAVAMDVGVANLKFEKGSGKFRILSEAVLTEKYGIGFKKGNVNLRDAVQETLKEMVKDGSAATISAKYFDGRNVIILKP